MTHDVSVSVLSFNAFVFKSTGYYTCVEVIFTLRRQVGFYMMGVYAPTLLIVVLSWLSFWINPDASAARVPLGTTSILHVCKCFCPCRGLDVREWVEVCGVTRYIK